MGMGVPSPADYGVVERLELPWKAPDLGRKRFGIFWKATERSFLHLYADVA